MHYTDGTHMRGMETNNKAELNKIETKNQPTPQGTETGGIHLWRHCVCRYSAFGATIGGNMYYEANRK